MRRDSCSLRKERLEEFRKTIFATINKDKTMEKKTAITWAMLNYGLTRAKAEEYLDFILETSNLVNDGGSIKIA